MDAPVEPPACASAFSVEAGGLHYSWRGWGREKTITSIGVYDVHTEQWTLRSTTGPSPPGRWDGGCAIIMNHLYIFGGFNKPEWFNDLHKLNLDTFIWSKVHLKHTSIWPKPKQGCVLVPVDGERLICFGGYIGYDCRTNEFHLFDIQEGVWSSPQVKGKRPPPCSSYTFTKVQQDRAVLFGGDKSKCGVVNNLHLFNLRNMEVTKVEPAQGDQWPEARGRHAACCLNYGEDHPVLLIFGGMGKDEMNQRRKVLGDMWILDVDSGKWTEVTPPESVRRRYRHSITATSLGPGLTEVLLFGGMLVYENEPIAETTILRFERSLSVTGPPTEKWALVDVAHNNTRGSSQRLREKREKIRQATHRLSSHSKEESEKCAQSFFVPVLPRNWTVVSNGEINKPVYQHKNNTEVTSSTPPGYPLYQISTFPGVTLYGEPQEREFPSTGGHADFNNGVEVTVSAKAVPPESTVGVKVQPGFASSDVFVMPEGIQSVSPSYLISSDSSAGLNGEVTVIMEHHVRVSTREEADDLRFLQADPTPDERSVYKYSEVSEGRSEFNPGESKGRLTTRRWSMKFLRIGSKFKQWFKRPKSSASSCPDDSSPPDRQPLAADRNLYTVRVYRSPPQQTTGDRLAIICVCLYGKLYSKFLNVLDNVVIPRDYPEVSTRVADRTIRFGLHFEDMFTALNIHPLMGWTVQPDKKEIFKTEASLPETEKFKPEDLHDYPPRITCRIYPNENAPERAACRMSLTGLTPAVEFSVPLKAKKSNVGIDVTKLDDATDKLRSICTVLQVTHPQLGSTVNSIVSLMERMTDALRSSSLSELVVHTAFIKTEVRSVLTIARRVAEECTRPTISESIEASLSKMEVLSHQLCQVAKVKLKHCQDQLEETAALVELVESGAGLLRTVDCLLRDMQTLSTISAYVNGLPNEVTLEKLMEDYSISRDQIDCEIEERDIMILAGYFDDVNFYLSVIGLSTSEQVDVRKISSNQIAMAKCLSLWRRHNPSMATLGALLDILLRLKKEEIASKLCDYYHPKHKPQVLLT